MQVISFVETQNEKNRIESAKMSHIDQVNFICGNTK